MTLILFVACFTKRQSQLHKQLPTLGTSYRQVRGRDYNNSKNSTPRRGTGGEACKLQFLVAQTSTLMLAETFTENQYFFLRGPAITIIHLREPKVQVVPMGGWVDDLY